MQAKSEEIQPLVLSVKQAAVRTGLAEITLNKLRWSGGGPPFVKMTATRVGYIVTDLDAWIKDRPRHRSTSDSGRAA
jgi:predicted DNA-binding transcriptional regulator AlpA